MPQERRESPQPGLSERQTWTEWLRDQQHRLRISNQTIGNAVQAPGSVVQEWMTMRGFPNPRRRAAVESFFAGLDPASADRLRTALALAAPCTPRTEDTSETASAQPLSLRSVPRHEALDQWKEVIRLIRRQGPQTLPSRLSATLVAIDDYLTALEQFRDDANGAAGLDPQGRRRA